MKTLAATISVGAAALSFSVVLCPSASAGPACPYDVSTPAGQTALSQYLADNSNQVANLSRSGQGAQAVQIERDASNVTLACSGHTPVSYAPIPQPEQAPVVGGTPSVDLGNPKQANNNGACANQYNIDNGSLPAQAISAIPLVSQGEALTQFGCAAGDLPNDIMNPSPANLGDTFGGLCNAAVAATTLPGGVPILGDPCGNTPAG